MKYLKGFFSVSLFLGLLKFIISIILDNAMQKFINKCDFFSIKGFR